MMQLQEVHTMSARRLSAEEFCALARRSESHTYRPRWEVMRMLTAGEAWGAGAPGARPDAGLLLIPCSAQTALAAALREARGTAQGWLLTPPLGGAARLRPLLAGALRAAERRAPGRSTAAVLEMGPGLDAALAAYFAAGFSLRALRPLSSLAPVCLLDTEPVPAGEAEVWLPLADATHLALLLARGWAAVAGRPDETEYWLRLVPLR